MANAASAVQSGGNGYCLRLERARAAQRQDQLAILYWLHLNAGTHREASLRQPVTAQADFGAEGNANLGIANDFDFD